jgi:MoaA/NifB/PqqE/SkfB family radical SAM enzyme
VVQGLLLRRPGAGGGDLRIHRWLDFKVTSRCNNAGRKCDYCDVLVDVPGAPERLSLGQIHQTLLDARALGFDIFWLLGGEPSIREDAHRLLEPLADDPEILITIVTNGRRPNWRMVEALFQTRAQRACVQVSFDTLTTENPKHARPDAVLEYVLALRDAARLSSTPAHACAVEVHCVISRANLRDFDELAGQLGRRGVPVSLAMVCPWQIVPEPRNLREFTREELLDVAGRIDHLRTGLPTDSFNPLVAGFLRRMLSSRGSDSRDCGAGLTHLVINGDGKVHRCMAESFRPKTALGSLCEDRLHAVLRKAPAPTRCMEGPACFDGFAWDQLALGSE